MTQWPLKKGQRVKISGLRCQLDNKGELVITMSIKALAKELDSYREFLGLKFTADDPTQELIVEKL